MNDRMIPPATDILAIGGDLVPPLDGPTLELLERGKCERVMILPGTEGGEGRRPYAVTEIEIDFENEDDLLSCVRLLRWSDDRLRARPDQLILWSWDLTYRHGMKIMFGVSWYDKNFFERRKDAFKEPAHLSYYSMFGATADRLKMRHRILS